MFDLLKTSNKTKTFFDNDDLLPKVYRKKHFLSQSSIVSRMKACFSLLLLVFLLLFSSPILAKLSTWCFEHSGDISCSLLINPSHTDESWEGRNTCMWGREREKRERREREREDQNVVRNADIWKNTKMLKILFFK